MLTRFGRVDRERIILISPWKRSCRSHSCNHPPEPRGWRTAYRNIASFKLAHVRAHVPSDDAHDPLCRFSGIWAHCTGALYCDPFRGSARSSGKSGVMVTPLVLSVNRNIEQAAQPEVAYSTVTSLMKLFQRTIDREPSRENPRPEVPEKPTSFAPPPPQRKKERKKLKVRTQRTDRCQ